MKNGQSVNYEKWISGFVATSKYLAGNYSAILSADVLPEALLSFGV